MDVISNIVESITNLPTLIIDGIKSIFIPSEEFINEKFNNMSNEIAGKFSFKSLDLRNLFQIEKPIEDIEAEYNIVGVGTVKGKIFNTEYLVKGVNYFRPYIRGFLMLLIALYNIRQAMSMFGLDSGEVAGLAGQMEVNERSRKK